MINIGGDASDASYRYKMPKLVTKVEGRGNGIKTVIVNMVDIAKSLHCDPAYPTKFFGIELGAQSKYNDKTERAIVNGCHDQTDCAKMLDKFIDLFILCPTCRLPEIKMNVKKSSIKIDCAACGHNGMLPTKHRLLTYILKDHADTKGGKKKEKKDKKKKKDKDDEETAAANEGDEVEPKEKKPKKKKDDKEAGEDEWITDTSKEAQRKRKEEEFAGMKANEHLKEVDEIIASAGGDNSASTVLKVFLASGKRTTTEIVSEVKRLQLARGLDEPQKIKVLLEAVIDMSDPNKIASEYKKNAALLSQFAAERAAAMILLSCIEEQVGVVKPALLSRTPVIIQVLYEEDVLDEDTILAWYEAPPEASWLVNKDVAVAVRGKALPFVQWLREAEEDNEGDEED